MYEVSDNFIRNSAMYGRQLDVRLSWDTTILGRDEVYKIAKKFDSDFYRSTMQQIDGEIKGRYDLTGKVINAQIGISYENSPYEYADYGNFYIAEHERIVGKTLEGDRTKFKAFDILIKTHVPYDVTELGITYPIKVIDLFKAIATHIGTMVINTELINGNKVILEDKWTNIENVTLRNVLDEIAATCGCTIVAKNNKLYGKYVDTTTSSIPFSRTINEDTMKSLKLQKKYGPVNILNLAREGIQSEDESGMHNNYPYPLNWETIPIDQRVEMVISDNQIMDKERELFAPSLFNSIKGLSYYPFEINGNGTIHFEPMDIVSIIDMNGEKHLSVITSCNLTFTTGIQEKLSSNIPGYTKEQYALVTDNKRQFMRVYFLVDQQNGIIKGLVEKQESTDRRVVELELTTESLSGSVKHISNTNMIPNFYGQNGLAGWTFLTSPVEALPKANNPAQARPKNSKPFQAIRKNGPVVNIINTDTESETAFEFWHAGEMISPQIPIVEDLEKYCLQLLTKGSGKLKFRIREYNEDGSIISTRQIAELTQSNSWSLVKGELLRSEDAKSFRLIILSSVSAYGSNPDYTTFADPMLVSNIYKKFEISAKDVYVYAQSGFELTNTEIKNAVKLIDSVTGQITDVSTKLNSLDSSFNVHTQRIDMLDGRTDNSTLKLSAEKGLEVWSSAGNGLTIYDSNGNKTVELLTNGTLKAVNAVISGDLTAGSAGGLSVTSQGIFFKNNKIQLRSDLNQIIVGGISIESSSYNGADVLSFVGSNKNMPLYVFQGTAGVGFKNVVSIEGVVGKLTVPGQLDVTNNANIENTLTVNSYTGQGLKVRKKRETDSPTSEFDGVVMIHGIDSLRIRGANGGYYGLWANEDGTVSATRR